MKEGFGWIYLYGLIIKCVHPLEAQTLMNETHNGFCGGHFVTKTTTHKIMRDGLIWIV